MMDTLAGWTADFIVNAAWQIPTIAVISYAALRVMGRPHPRVEHLVWTAALVASVALPAWAATQPGGSGSPALLVESPWLAAELLGLAFLASLALGAFSFARSWSYVRRLRRLPALADPSDEMLQVAESCAQALAITTPQVKICDVQGPATIGVTHPVVLLPQDFSSQEDGAVLRAAIGHEAAHIARKDYLVNLLAELLSIAIGAHPVTYWIKRHLKASREKACDAVVADRVLSSRDYARSVLSLAAANGAGREVRLAPGVLDGGDLASRLRALLDRRTYATSLASRVVLLVAAAALLVVGWNSAHWLRPKMPEFSPAVPKAPPPPPKELKRRLSDANPNTQQ